MHVLLIRHVVFLATVAALPLAGGVALIKGDKAERWGAGAFVPVVLANSLIVAALQGVGFDKAKSVLYFDLGSCLILSSYFLYLSVRYASLWLAAAMVVQGTDFYFNQAYLDAEQPNESLYVIQLDLVCFFVLAILGSAAIWSWCARIRKRKEAARREEAAQRRQEAWAKQYESLLAGRLAEVVAAPAQIRGGRGHLIIEPTLP